MAPRDPDYARLTDLIAQAREQTLRLIEVAAADDPGGRQRFGARPVIRFDLRGVTAGQLRIDQHGHCTIRYNPALLLRHGADFLARTVPHETAHFLAYRLHGRGIRPHGLEWQAIMRRLGADPTRCHDYDIEGLSARRLSYFDYHCDCRDHRLSTIRHNKVRRGTSYLCRQCGTSLRPGKRGR